VNKEAEKGAMMTMMDDLVYSNLAILIGTTDPTEKDTMVKVPVTLHIPEDIFLLLTRVCASIARTGSTEKVFDVYLSSVLARALVRNSVFWAQSDKGKEILNEISEATKGT